MDPEKDRKDVRAVETMLHAGFHGFAGLALCGAASLAAIGVIISFAAGQMMSEVFLLAAAIALFAGGYWVLGRLAR